MILLPITITMILLNCTLVFMFLYILLRVRFIVHIVKAHTEILYLMHNFISQLLKKVLKWLLCIVM